MNEVTGHRKRVRHYHEPGHLHELTFSCYQRRPLLTNDDWCTHLARTIDRAGSEEKIELVAFVVMPEHVHLLVYPVKTNPDIGRYLARIKQPFSKQIKEVLVQQRSRLLEKLRVRERPGKTCFRFWQEGPGFDRNLFTPDAISASVDYVHQNPVRRGLCRNVTDWKWSSTLFYLGPPLFQRDPDLPHIHGLPAGALD